VHISAYIKKREITTTINQLCSTQLQKEVKSNPKTAQLLKKVCGPQEGHCEKDVKSKVAAKILIMTIQVNLVPNHSEMWRRQHKFV